MVDVFSVFTYLYIVWFFHADLLNYQVIIANDAEEALASYIKNQDKIKTVIVDIMMPNIDGFTTIDRLQNINPHLRIIAISGLVNGEHLNIENRDGPITFLPKPFTLQELLKTLDTLKNQ